MKKLLLSFSAVVLAALVLSLGLYSWWRQQLTPVITSDTSQFTLVVDPNETGASALQKLYSAGVIRSVGAARVYLRFSGLSGKLRPGSYLVSPGQSLSEIISTITSGPNDVWVTIPEGWRREQIATRLKATFPDFDSANFLSQTATLEGQLFPDTYLIPAYANSLDVISIFSLNLTKKTSLSMDTVYQITMGKDTINLTGREILILASLIEREVRQGQDRRLVAGILINRLLLGMPLQVDATVQFAQDTITCQSAPLECKYWEPILETKVPSLYNTYQHAGLPPGAIANPGLASISAVREPQDSEYFYYLTDDSGITHYARTLSEHNINIDKYLLP